MTEVFGRTTPVDLDDDDDVTPVAELSDLQALAAELGDVEREPVVLNVPDRDGYAVRYGTKIEYGQLQVWRKRAKDPQAPDGINLLTFCALILANQCQAIIRHGAEVEIDGEAVTFASESFRTVMGASRARDCVVKVYGVDPHVIAAATSVLSASGYDDEVSEAGGDDPTRR